MKNILQKTAGFLIPLLLALCLAGQASAFPGLTARLAAEPNLQAREEIMTREHMQMSEEAQNLALKLYRHLVYGEPINHSDLK